MRFRRHAAAFVGANIALHVANAFVGESWWAFWPLALWGFALGLHYMLHRARHSDERWVKERTEEVRAKSYDRAHMDDIAKGPSEK